MKYLLILSILIVSCGESEVQLTPGEQAKEDAKFEFAAIANFGFGMVEYDKFVDRITGSPKVYSEINTIKDKATAKFEKVINECKGVYIDSAKMYLDSIDHYYSIYQEEDLNKY